MARITLIILLSFLNILSGTDLAGAGAPGAHGGSGSAPGAPAAASFIRSSCKATRYPTVCVQSLLSYASTIQKSPKQLVMTALSVSIDRAQSTRSFVNKLTKFRGLKPREYAAIKDCAVEVSDSVEQISKSVRELKNMGRARGPEFEWHLSNVQTWVSAALTDDSTCSDGFAGGAMSGRIKSSIRAQMTGLAQVTSNALALCNHFAGKY